MHGVQGLCPGYAFLYASWCCLQCADGLLLGQNTKLFMLAERQSIVWSPC